VVKRGVNVFFEVEKKGTSVFTELLADIKRMNQLCEGYPPLLLEEEDKAEAWKGINEMRDIEAKLKDAFARYRPGTKMDGKLGREVAQLMARYLQLLVIATETMDVNQLKRILRSIKKAFEVVVMMKDTSNDYRFEQKCETYRTNMHSLTKNIETRVEALENGENKSILAKALKEVEDHQESLLQTTQTVLRNPSQSNLAAQQNDLRAILTAIQAMSNVIKLPAPKSRAGFDLETIFNENLDHLRDAVTAGSATATADAARKILDQINKMQEDADRSPDGDDDAARRARQALEDAANRLKKKTGDLLGAAKDALQNPDASHQKALNDVIADMRDNVSRVGREFDTVETGLKKSGMIEAAAQAALELQNLFLTDE